MDDQNQTPIPQNSVPQVPPTPPDTTPTVVASPIIQPNATFPAAQPVINNQVAQDTQPISRSDFEREANKKAKGRKLFKIILTSIVAIVLIGVGGLLAKNLLSNLNTKTLTNGGYTYSFKFYKSAKLVTVQGVQSYNYSSGHVTAVANPTTQPLQTNCTGQVTEAFSVTVNGSGQPVCTGDNGTVQLFEVHFRAVNSNQYFLLLYPSQSSPSNATLKTIFSSIKVSQ